MASYTRQSSFADGDTITAALFNNEFNQLVNAFHNSTGHKHDGTAAEGPVIGLIGDAGETAPNNKVLIDTTNNFVEFYVQVASAPVQQLYIADGAIIPVTDSDIDLGTSSLYFKNAYIDSITTTGNVDVGGNLTVTGTTTFNGGTITMGDAATDNVVFGADVDSNIIPDDDDTYDLGSASQEWRNLYIDGTANIDSLVADTADINGGTIDGVTIGGTTAGAVTFTDLSDGTITITAFADEDDMSSDSATLVPTQQSVKAYVDSQVTAQDLDFQGDTGGALSIDLDSEALTIAGGTGLDTVGSGNTVTVNIDSTVATLTGTQTLTNKTIDAASNTLSNIANSSLTNSTVSYGGVSLALGASDATPAFDLTDATNYPTSSLTGTITNAQLAGSIEVSKTLLAGGTGLTLSTNTLSVDAAQTQITSVGTLGSLTVSGDLTIDTNTLVVDSTNNRVGILDATPAVSLDAGSATDAFFVPKGTTAQRPTGVDGYFRYNTDDAQFEGYADGEWGAIAGSGSGSGSAIEPQIFAGDGSTVNFTLTSAPTSENNLLVFIDGVFQAHDSYSVSGTTLTFSTAPANTRVVTVYHARSNVSGANMIVDTMTGDNSDVTLTLSVAPVSVNNVQVYFDGVYQNKANYSISGTTLTFSTAPATGVAVEAITHTQTTINVPANGTVTSAKLDTNIAIAGTLGVTGDITGTLATAAQPNITSVGTLTGFTSGGIDDNSTSTMITLTNGYQVFLTDSSNSSQEVNIGTSSTLGGKLSVRSVNNEAAYFHNNGNGGGTGNAVAAFKTTSFVSTTYVQAFYNSSGTLAGSISLPTGTSTTTAFNTSSDYRLKENVDYTWDATTRIKQLKPARFSWISDDTNTLVDGFIAHEVSDIVPEAVAGEKDAIDEEGNPAYQGIDQSKLVPLLVKTIQELEARITTLENA